ncbi:hypothetical protein Csa_023063 [Cucumis sativus]|nr:hypothetical protein Csa_023063 [Cucumis sativus]
MKWDLINENTLMKVIRGLNKSTGVVLEYLQEAKEHGHRKGKDILASIPGYWEVICSIFEGEDEHMFISAQLLPAIRYFIVQI